jgi:hypothetical protein
MIQKEGIFTDRAAGALQVMAWAAGCFEFPAGFV